MNIHQQAILALPGCRPNTTGSTATVTAWTHAGRLIRLFHDAKTNTWDAVQRGDVLNDALDIESDQLPTAHEAIADLRLKMLTAQGEIMERIHRAYPFPAPPMSAATAAAEARTVLPDATIETMYGNELTFVSPRTGVYLRLRGATWSAMANGDADSVRGAVAEMLQRVGMLR